MINNSNTVTMLGTIGDYSESTITKSQQKHRRSPLATVKSGCVAKRKSSDKNADKNASRRMDLDLSNSKVRRELRDLGRLVRQDEDEDEEAEQRLSPAEEAEKVLLAAVERILALQQKLGGSQEELHRRFRERQQQQQQQEQQRQQQQPDEGYNSGSTSE